MTGSVDLPMIPPGMGGVFDNKPRETPAIVPIRFETDYEPGPNGEMVGVDWVEWAKKGEDRPAHTREKVARLMANPSKGRPAAIEWSVIEPYYKAWKAGEEDPTVGTPLHAWPGIPRQMADELRSKFRILSVEDFAGMADHVMSRIPFPGVREMRSRAKAFVEARSAADMSMLLAERDAKLDTLTRQLADLQARLSAAESAPMPAAVADHEEDIVQPGPNDVLVTEHRRGPGRPRKAEMEAA